MFVIAKIIQLYENKAFLLFLFDVVPFFSYICAYNNAFISFIS